jgi:AraC-like DNA-binding protein
MHYTDFDLSIPTVAYFVNRRCTPAWRIEKDVIDFHDLTYVYSGHAVYVVNGSEYRLGPGDFIYVPKGSVRQAYTGTEDPMCCYAVNFHLESTIGGFLDLPFPTTFNFGTAAELTGLYDGLETAWVEKNPGYQMKSRAFFMLILHWAFTRIGCDWTMAPLDDRIDRVREHILANYRRKLDMKSLAELSGLHPVYLGALFKKVNHCTIKEYINRIRINSAENLLSAGGYSVSEAAGQCGFDDIYYFSKVYKKLKGYPPSKLIRKK